MTTDLAAARRFYAEEIETVCNLRPSLVEAFARVRREDFLRPGPWTFRADGDLAAGVRTTADADPRRVYHNVAIAIDPPRQLYNGQPGTLGLWMELLGIDAGARVLHVGCGLGYYTAVMAECVGRAGRVVAYEVDQALAEDARANLAAWPWVEVRHADATERLNESFDAILVNAGVTGPQPAWLDAMAPKSRMALPMTCTMEAMGTIGKGVVFIISQTGDATSFAVRPLTMVAIYSAVGTRDGALNHRLGKALMAGPAFMKVQRLRRDPHEESATCWVHADGWCLSTA
jgi:protein-L-isoaspartate(D-aspartate) O-methyltransferase